MCAACLPAFPSEIHPSRLQFDVPVAEVSVQWTEMAGSKIRFTSILHMAFELVTIKVGLRATVQCFGVVG